MKTIINAHRNLQQLTLIPLMFAILAFFANSSNAQISIGANVVVQNYVPPPWAPPYDNTSSIRYYYFPDYGMYYDVWDGQYWYLGPGGEWISSDALPPAYAGVDLNSSFIVLIDRDVDRPWTNYGYYYHNYPAHGYQNYTDIVARNRIVVNTAPGHALVPRAFNENNNRVTFMQRPTTNTHAPATYHHVVHEVPMQKIAPSMPAESKNLNYGRGYTKPSGGAPKGGSAPRGGNAPKGGNAPRGGGGKR